VLSFLSANSANFSHIVAICKRSAAPLQPLVRSRATARKEAKRGK